MKTPVLQRRTLALLAVLVPLLILFVFVAIRSGPLAPVAVTLTTVEEKVLAPALFGIGTVEARYTYRIGPTMAGRLMRLDVQVGDRVAAGRVLGEMEPVDLDERIRAQEAALERARAQLVEAETREGHARREANRYELLLQVKSVSEELAAARRHELRLAEAGRAAARQEVVRLAAEQQALAAQRRDLRLLAPVDCLVAARESEPGSTVVAGQTVVECIDPASLWVNVRFDQIQARGLAPDRAAEIILRSRPDEVLVGRLLRVEPLADAVTEEMLAKVVFADLPDPLPPLGELAEVTVTLPDLPAAPVIPNAAVQSEAGRRGVWKVTDDALRFTPVTLGMTDLDGRVQVLDGLAAGDQVVLYSERALSSRSRIRVVEHLVGAGR